MVKMAGLTHIHVAESIDTERVVLIRGGKTISRNSGLIESNAR